MFGFSFSELKQRVAAKIQHLDATSSSALTEAVLGPLSRLHSIVRIRLFRYEQLKRKTLFLLSQKQNF